MSSLDLSSLVLGWIGSYGAPIIALLLFMSGLGLPLPATLIVVASGAFIRQELLDQVSAPLLGYAGVILGDILLFSLGHFASQPVIRRYGSTAAWMKARGLFERRGGAAIFLTRWLLTAVALPTTLIAATSQYRFRRFLLVDLLGEFIWIALYGGMGYLFGSQWELISDFISDFSGFLLGALVLGGGVYLMVRFSKKPQPVPPVVEAEATA